MAPFLFKAKIASSLAADVYFEDHHEHAWEISRINPRVKVALFSNLTHIPRPDMVNVIQVNRGVYGMPCVMDFANELGIELPRIPAIWSHNLIDRSPSSL